MTLQKLRVRGTIVNLSTNNQTGMISVVTNRRLVYNFKPVPTKCSGRWSEKEPVTLFGNYFWVRGKFVDCGMYFGNGNGTGNGNEKNEEQKERVPVHNTNTSTSKMLSFQVGNVSVGSSMDFKLLIANADQIAVFDISPEENDWEYDDDGNGVGDDYGDGDGDGDDHETMDHDNSHEDMKIDVDDDDDYHDHDHDENNGSKLRNRFGSGTQKHGDILWTTRVRATISTAAISGDGRSIAYVLQGEGVGVPYPYGVRTLIRDKEDGSFTMGMSAGVGAGLGSGQNLRPPRPPPPSRGTSVGAKLGESKLSPQQQRTGGITPPPVPGISDSSKCQYPEYSMHMNGSGSGSGSGSGNANNNMGIVFKPGPFLVHSTTVTRISFRGLGLNHSSIYHEESISSSRNRHSGNGISGSSDSQKPPSAEPMHQMRDGNDLLLTCCSTDGSFRVFSQGSWKMLFHWDTPPGSRADWIHGISMANLGDLDPLAKGKMKGKNGLTPMPSTDSNSGDGENNGDGGNANGNSGSGMGKKDTPNTPQRSNSTGKKINQTRNTPSATSGWQSQLMPNTAAGAWISELTFRGPYPALRLSRLSFLKSGGDVWAPAHFDSVGTILPPTTILPQCVLNNLESTSMVVQGIWSAWNPWVAHPGSGGNVVEDESLSGNAMALLGSVPFGYGESVNDADVAAFGGTHSPPAELRIVASHAEDKVVIMEFPLWGDADFGAMQLGSPLRYLLNFKECVPEDVRVPKMIENYGVGSGGSNKDHSPVAFAPLPVTVSTRCVCLDFESNSLCAAVTEDRRNVTLEWRKKGTMNIYRRQSDDTDDSNSDISTATTASLDSAERHEPGEKLLGAEIEQFSDWSINPLPLSLPSLHLPTTAHSDECISLLEWWPDENFGGPPRLFAFTTAGTLILYEMPPPWCALEPITPDPYTVNAIGCTFHSQSEHGSLSDRGSYEEDDHDSFGNVETSYEVQLTPHPDFGLGLRLEAQIDGTPAIAGSYKKHPLTGGRLPAERTGKIVLGDELISVNNVSLEGMTFDDVIATVRTVSAAADGGPLLMKFRALERNRMLRENLSNLTSDRLPFDEGLEIVHQRTGEDGDHASNLMRGDAETQQEFGKIVAIIPCALPSFIKTPRSLVLLPWHYGKGAPKPYEVRGASLLVSAVGRTISAARMEVYNGFEPESCGNLTRLGSVDIQGDSSCDIISLVYIKTVSDGWCVGVCDGQGQFQVVFIDVIEGDDNCNLSAKFRICPILDSLDTDTSSDNTSKEYLIRASSVELMGSMPVGGNCTEVSIWTSSPFVSNVTKEKKEDPTEDQCSYTLTKISHKNEPNRQPILDFQWLSGGGLNAYPWLVTFSQQSAVVHCRPGNYDTWVPVTELFYPPTKEMCGESGIGSLSLQRSLTPSNIMPHLISILRNIVSTTEEEKSLLSDWHPESMLAILCSEPHGPEQALKTHIKGLTKWLSQAIDPKDSLTIHWDPNSRLPSAPFDYIYNNSCDNDNLDANSGNGLDSAATLFKTVLPTTKQSSEDERRFEVLQDCIHSKFEKCTLQKLAKFDSKPKFSREFTMAMNASKQSSVGEKDDEEVHLPDPIKDLSTDELCFLWSLGEICNKPPIFKGLDKLAQLMVLSVAITRQVKESNYEDVKSQTSLIAASPRSFLMKKASSSSFFETTTAPREAKIASSACLAALISDSQSALLKACKSGERWSWEEARITNLPFWVRSDDDLRKISEEIAQHKYKESMDVMESALFYIITGNMKKLKTIAATDRSHTGRTFLKFLTSYDFSSARGRKAAEKNAFSLLRKRKYGPAVAFFLLAEPPILNSALNVIETKMEDLALAFFVSRLIDSNRSKPTNPQNDGLTIGGGFSLRGIGGGGGFASYQPDISDSDDNELDNAYANWKPHLSKKSKELLESQAGRHNLCSQCIHLLWLNRPNDAAMCLLGTSHSDRDTIGNISQMETLPSSFRSTCKPTKNHPSETATCRVVNKANEIFDFAARPAIVKQMKLPNHAQWYINLSASRALCRRGIELSSMIILPELTIVDKKEQPSNSHQHKSTESTTSSSIFDSFDAPQQKTKVHTLSNTSDQKPSSIFDAFDAPPPKPKVQASSTSDAMSSSIFDTFDAPPPKPKVQASTTSGEMTSSIFDSFDAPNAPSHSQLKTKASSQQSIEKEKAVVEEICDSAIVDVPVPQIWDEWRQNILTTGVARRLLREMARVITPFLGDVDHTPIDLFRRHIHPLIPYNAAHVFQEVCEGETILSILVDILDQLCSSFDVSKAPVVERALLIIGCPRQPHRIVFAVLLHCLTGRADLGEDVMRDTAQGQVDRCEALLSSNDDLVFSRKSKHHASSQYMRRQAASASLQLEICLWLHRGGAFPMSGLALKEATVGVRIGYTVAGWGRCHEAIESLLKCDPDCTMDFERGRQLWSSMKMILSGPETEEKIIDGAETTSGGWEFLVDCDRDEATQLLRPRKCGSFLLRPNPEDHGIFTLSFRTNLKPPEEVKDQPENDIEGHPKRKKKRDESVQHAIVRLSDAGFKCGSFGPFSSLLKLLDAVSTSLPFDLLFSEPPAQGIIKEEGAQPSPNSVFIRKLALHSKTDNYRWNASTTKAKSRQSPSSGEQSTRGRGFKKEQSVLFQQTEQEKAEFDRLRQFGMFSQLLVLTELRKQISAVVASHDENLDQRSTWKDSSNKALSESFFEGSLQDSTEDIGELELDAIASRMIRPFLNWCQAAETSIVDDLLPKLSAISQRPASSMPVALSASATAIEAVPIEIGTNVDCGDAIIRRMIQMRSGVEFRTLRVGEAGHSAVVVLFRRSQAITWITTNKAEMNMDDAAKRLDIMERRRVIEKVDLNAIAYEPLIDNIDPNESENDNDIRYRFVDPWEVEVLDSKDAELRGAALGRERYVPFTIGAVARACEESQRDLGGLHLLSLWATARGGVCLTKAISSVYPPWERDAGGDLEVVDGIETQASTYANCFRQHLYRNTIFHRLRLPQRFLALIQVEVLDLKNLTAPGGSPSVTAYALLRLKRDASNAPLTHKARTLDSASTEPRKIHKSSGPNAPASWGSVVRFRFPLPEDVNCDGVSFDSDREALFKGAPSVLQISVYEKKFMTNSVLGGADVNLDGLSTSGQLEEWVPLRSTNDDITWFARLRLTLRFELMCLASNNKSTARNLNDQCPSAGLRKMKILSRMGGAHEDENGVQRSLSSPDIVTYFENMVS